MHHQEAEEGPQTNIAKGNEKFSTVAEGTDPSPNQTHYKRKNSYRK